jgi:hypothetical protein
MSMIGSFLQLSPTELQMLIDDPSLVESFIYPDGEEHPSSIDVDKAWHGIHFMLTGDAWGGGPPLCNVVLGGTEIGDDIGYGPARYITADEVRAAADVLRELPSKEFARRFDSAAMSENEIYPEIWDEVQESLDYLMSNYELVRDYYSAAASKGNAMLKYLS